MLSNYLKIAWRNLLRYRNFTMLNTVGLGVGVAGALLIFLFLRYHLSTDRHQPHFNRIVRISTDLHLDDGSVEYNAEGPPPLAKALRTHYPQVEQAGFLLGIRELNVSLRRPGETQITRFLEHEGIGFVEPDWLEVMTYAWLQGDPKTALRAPNQAVLTESWAKRYFGTVNALGQTLTLDNKAVVRVTGIVADPPGPTDTDLGLFVSLPTMYQVGVSAGAENDWWMLNSINRVYARLRNPDAITSLQATLPTLAKQHYGKMAQTFQFVVQPLADLHFDVARDPTHAVQPTLLWSLAVVGLLLIVAACINFINLATAQTLRRGKEVGIRKTLGSSRGQLAGQFLLETLLVSVAATGLGVVLASLTLPLFANWLRLPLSLQPDALTVGFVFTLLFVVVALSGAYPALVLSGVSPWSALRGKLTASAGGLSVRRGLVVVQFVVCQGLIIGALVINYQVRFMQQTDPGFAKDNVVTVRLPYGQKARHDAFKQKLSAYAPIRSVSLSALPPATVATAMNGGQIKANGKPDWESYPVRERLADADYLPTYGLRLLAGRNITPGDTIRDYVINEALMRKLGFQRPEQALGYRLQYHLSAVPLPIVGVVKDFYQRSLRHEVGPCLIANWSAWYRTAGIRIAGQNPAQTLQFIEQTWQQVFPDQVFEYEFLDKQVARLYETERLTGQLVSTFTLLAILICCLGLFGLVSHVVVQRTKEIGVRKVLGASVMSIVALLSKDFLVLVLIAILLASPVAWYAMSRWLEGFAYKIAIEWWVFALAGLLAVGIALVTVSFQSVKAALMNPVKSLRSE